MSTALTAIVLGGTGSVGGALLNELFHAEGFESVVTLSRRALPEAASLAQSTGRKHVQKLVPNMNPMTLGAATLEAAREASGEVVGFSVLGVGAGTAKLTLEQHRAIDVELNQAFASALKESGKVGHLAFMSAVGADAKASTAGSGAAGMPRYSRVKGESEEAVRAHGPKVVSVFRPAMIIGSKHTPWLLEKTLPLLSFVTPARFKSISVQQIAQAMVASARQRPTESATYHYPEMMSLIASG